MGVIASPDGRWRPGGRDPFRQRWDTRNTRGNSCPPGRCYNGAMDVFERIAEERIRSAMERGEFDDLPGRGKPLRLEDDRNVPEDLRMAFRVLRNAGCLPPEMELRKEIHSLGELLRAVDDEQERRELTRQLDLRLLKFNMMRRTPFHLDSYPGYRDRILDRLAGCRDGR